MNKEITRRSRRRRASAAPTDSQADWQALATLRRYRFLRPLCSGKRVADLGHSDAGRALIADTAEVVQTVALDDPPPRAADAADMVLHLEPVAADEVTRLLPALSRRIGQRGILALAVAEGGDATAARQELAKGYRNVACFRERPVAGSIILDERFAQSRVVPLQDAAGGSGLALYVCSNAVLPTIPGGLFEEQLLPPVPLDASNAPPIEAGGDTVRFGAMLADIADALDEQVADPNTLELQERAVSLVERLLEVEDQTLALRGETHRLRNELASSGGGGGGDSRYASIPRTKHEWPLAESTAVTPAELGPYDRRVDDDVVLEGRRGEVFFERFKLLEETPDFAAAVAALNAMDKTLRVIEPSDDTQPDMSIVIPIYGQLSYTLNCLESLFLHKSKYTAEIIIIDDVSPDVSGDFLPQVQGITHFRQPVNGGFIMSCARGGELSRGRFVVMLNNDTRVVEGWLDELIDAFTLFPKAGAVGSKLFYPDGVLQEAGGIIWRDGTAWNFGRNDDPNRPQYSYARQVDYISGASLALPMDLWREIDGFDKLYKPAYCEDSDLCLKIVAMGREMWFQPRSRIVHYEGKTSGTDTRVGVKAYQVINQKRLFMRWRERLTQHRPNGEAPVLERERNVRKRALIIDATNPTPKQDAGSVTTTLTLGLFQDLGYKAHFVPQDNFLFQPIYTTDLQRTGIEVAYAPYEVSFETYMRRYGFMLDVVLVYRVTVLEKVLDVIRLFAPQAPVLFHNMDLHFLRMEREAEMEGREELFAAAAEMKVKECELIRQVDCTITHSTFEKEVLAKEVPGAPVVVWPFMFEFFGTQVPFEPRRDIVFLGGYRHSPNVDAVKFFAQDVFPLILQQEPNARFVIAGANPTDEVLALASDNIVVTGLVDDLRDVFDTSRLFACSLRIGAGTKGKVSTAMSYGLPVVSTDCGAEGMNLVDGEEVLIANDAVAFAEACLKLYRDKALWDKISENGMKLVQEKHSLAMGRRVLGEAIDIAYNHQLGLVAAA